MAPLFPLILDPSQSQTNLGIFDSQVAPMQIRLWPWRCVLTPNVKTAFPQTAKVADSAAGMKSLSLIPIANQRL